MKVAILSPYPTLPFHDTLECREISYENNATWTVALADTLAQLPDTEVHVLTESTVIPRTRILQVNNVTLHFIKAPEQFKTLTLWHFDRVRLHGALAEIEPDIVHGQGIENQYGFAAVTFNRPHLLTIHGIPKLAHDALNERPLSRGRIVELLARSALKKARNVVVINPFVTGYYQWPAGRYRLFPIPNAIEQHFFTAPPAPRESDLILAVGSMDRRKGHDVLLRALAILKRRQRPVRAIIAGPSGEERQVTILKQFIQSEQLDVQLTGFLPPAQILPLMQRCTILALPSRHETAPMVVAEAMALRTPVVAAEVGGVRHMLRDHVTGLLFQSGNASELADKIQALLENKSVRDQLGEAAGKSAQQAHAPDRVARLTRAAYETVLNNGASHP